MTQSIDWAHRYMTTRQWTEELCRPLQPDDFVIQACEDVSPPKWHLAHTSWFFETFLLVPHLDGYRVYHPLYSNLFNSYYKQVGPHIPRTSRGILSRPTVEDVYAYRRYIDEHIVELIESHDFQDDSTLRSLLELGLHHEQQHQELLLMDIKLNFYLNPLKPIYIQREALPHGLPVGKEWIPVKGGLVHIGHSSGEFAFDNESPRHEVWLSDYMIASRPITNGEFLEFIEAGGYQRPEYWLADGWDTVQKEQWSAPLYWEKIDNNWWIFTLSGYQKLDLHEPVCHVSFYEADAYGRWAGARLPTEAEWEHAFRDSPTSDGHFLESGIYHPRPALCAPYPETTKKRELLQGFGDVWEWTYSPYRPYPGFRPPAGAVGEYNGKFMNNQMVLRGGSCVTPADHVRVTYRNFYSPAKRWPFTGIRLARDLEGGQDL